MGKYRGYASLGQYLMARPPGGRRVAAWAGRVRALTASEWLVLGESALLALGIEAALHLVPLTRVLSAVQGHDVTAVAASSAAARAHVARLARRSFMVLPVPASCLRVALVQVAVLRRRHVPATVRFGVQRLAGGELAFHAWADCDGPIDDPAGAAGYAAFEPVTAASLSRSARWSPPAAPPDAAG